MTKRQYAPREQDQRAGTQSRLAFPGSSAGAVRNSYPIHKADRTAVRVPTSTTLSAETFWVEDHFTVSSTTPGTFTLSYVPRTNSEDITVNGITLLPATEWTRSGVTLTVDSGVWLGLTGTWDLLVQYEVAAAAPTVTRLGYSAAILNDGPIAYYRLGEASGTVMVDSSGNGHDGTFVNSPTHGVPGLLAGDTDTATLFTAASTQYGDVAHGAWMDVTNITLEAIIKPNSSGMTGAILDRDSFNYSTQAWTFIVDGGVLKFYWSSGAPGGGTTFLGPLVGSTSLVGGTRYHVAATYDGTNAVLYVNGVQDATVVSSPTGVLSTTSVAHMFVGASGAGTAAAATPDVWWFDGVIDEAAIYSSALPAGTIAEHAALI